eukprot:CAMPEP_0195292622 /NCGR_PEP_ID=MMETSP0707-20130614/10325_1 /TAXON_ID=33640 /ORGANISM="Asterionellopsis glacialis, Strain CCMP134" /LENGTH=161 /DNA_ID=CAMNT_0040353139 /DNA_START=162 /DNA_END=647 /DNA_ORIENTATION=+
MPSSTSLSFLDKKVVAKVGEDDSLSRMSCHYTFCSENESSSPSGTISSEPSLPSHPRRGGWVKQLFGCLYTHTIRPTRTRRRQRLQILHAKELHNNGIPLDLVTPDDDFSIDCQECTSLSSSNSTYNTLCSNENNHSHRGSRILDIVMAEFHDVDMGNKVQ